MDCKRAHRRSGVSGDTALLIVLAILGGVLSALTWLLLLDRVGPSW